MAITYTPIASVTLSSAQSSVTFSGIPQTYTDLVIVVSGNSSGGDTDAYLQFNGDTGNNYSRTRLDGDGSSATSGRTTSTSVFAFTGLGVFTTTGQSNSVISINNYSNTTTYKTPLARMNNASKGVDAIVGLWRNTSAITQIDVVGTPNNFASGSTFTLYGIKSA